MNHEMLEQIVGIIDAVDDMTIATLRDDGFPQATTVSYVNDGLTIYFGTTMDSQKAKNISQNNKISITINRPYENWNEIEGVSIGATAQPVSDPAEQKKVGELLFKKFPQINEYFPEDTNLGDPVLFRIEPIVISLLDYRRGFGHTELVSVTETDRAA